MRASFAPVRKLLLVAALAAAAPALAQESVNYSYTWWNAAEPGWGYNLSHQGDVLYGTWYSYADDGKPMFLTVEARLAADGSFTGPVYRVAGTPFQQINGSQAFTAVTEVGNAQMSFSETGELELTYTIDGSTQTRTLTRFTFADNPPVCVGTTASRADADNYSDLWWNPSEAGWGLTLSHQGDVIFVLWYTYGEGGRDQWISGATLVRQPDGSYVGALQRPTSGTPLLQIAGPATAFPVPEVGSATLVFSDGQNGQFSYTLDGVTQSKPIKRFVAVGADAPKPLCRVESGGGGGGGGGSTENCFPDQLIAGDTRNYRITDQQTQAVETNSIVVIGPSSFNGEAAIMSEQRLENGDLNRVYERIDGSDYLFIGEQAVQGGMVVQEGRFNPFPRTPLAPPLGQKLAQNYAGSSTAAGTTTQIQYQDSLTLIRRESVTSPAGTFDNACYLERELTVIAAGITTNIEFEIWTRGDVGEIRSIARTQIGGPFPISTSVLKELTGFDLSGVVQASER